MRVIEARRFLSGGLITFDDGLRLLQGRHKFRPGHQCSGMAGLDCATRRNRYGDGSHALDVRHVGDQNNVIVALAVPTTDHFASDRISHLPSNGFNAVLRIIHLRCP